MKKVMTMFLICFFSQGAQAAWADLSSFKLWTTTNGADLIRVFPIGTSVINDNNTCADPDSYMVSTNLTPEAIARIYSTLLAAKMADKPVLLYIAGCENDRPAIKNVVLN